MNNDKNKGSVATVATVMPVRRAAKPKLEKATMPELASQEKKDSLHREFSSSVPGARPGGGGRYRDLGSFDRSLLVSSDVVRPPRRLG